MPDTWSDWVAFVGAVIGSVTGILGLILAYASLRRDRSDIDVRLKLERYAFTAMLEHEYPGVRFGPHRARDTPQEWFVLSAVNTGLRPVHVEKAVIIWVEVHGPGSSSWSVPHDIVLNEERRRASLAFTADYHADYDLWLVQFVHDTGREYTAYGPSCKSVLRRRSWERQRARILETERRNDDVMVPPSHTT